MAVETSGGGSNLLTGLGIGTAAAEFLAGLFSGTGGRKKKVYNALGGLSSQIGGMRGRLNPTNLLALTRVGLQPDINKYGRELDRRYGFDSGKAGGEFTKQISQLLSGLRPQLEKESAAFDLRSLIEAAQVKAQQGQYA